MSIRRLTAVLAICLFAACSESSGPPVNPPDTPGIHFLAGATQTDTIDASLAQALMVEVRDTAGNLAAAQVVRFEVPADTVARLTVSAIASSTFGSFVAETTNAQGQAGVLIRFGAATGTARLRVLAPVYGFVDTASFTVMPGKPFRVFAQPRDTSLDSAATFQVRGYIGDRRGNSLPGAVTYQALDAGVTTTPAGIVTARQSGSYNRVIGTAPGLTPDTVRVTVGLAGTIVASSPTGLTIINLNGTGQQNIPIGTADYQGRYPTWLSATSIAAMDGRYYADVLRVNTAGGVNYLVPTADSVVLEVWPQASRDGAWIYFGGLVPGYTTAGISIWRVSPDGLQLQRVSPPNADGTGDTYPSPSPDGGRVAVATTRSGSFSLAVIDVATRVLTPLNIAGAAPRWAPSGDTIAYLFNQEIWVVNANGGGARRVSPPGRAYLPGMDWSPSRRHIIAARSNGLEIVEVATGIVTPLPNLPTNLAQPAWKP